MRSSELPRYVDALFESINLANMFLRFICYEEKKKEAEYENSEHAKQNNNIIQTLHFLCSNWDLPATPSCSLIKMNPKVEKTMAEGSEDQDPSAPYTALLLFKEDNPIRKKAKAIVTWPYPLILNIK
uniref:Uncharacterized protein n=1 Tax=Rhodnius prolixus TaxID=13249 RepID=T1HGJ1_RHOPR